VSRWLPDDWQFTLAPDSVLVARTPHRFGRGDRRQAPQVTGQAVAHRGEQRQPWAAALAVLADSIAGAGVGGRATVILANQFVRYALVPWSDLIESEEEGLSLSRHYLHETYGAAAERWQLRIDPEEASDLKLISAVEPELLEDLRRLYAGSRLRLVSIQPRLMALCNRHRRRLAGGDTWLALVEPNSLCLALLQDQHFAALRQVRVGDAWAAELVTTLERESLLVDAAAAVRHVFVAAAGVAEPRFAVGMPWTIEWLEPLMPAQAPTPTDRPLAAATGG